MPAYYTTLRKSPGDDMPYDWDFTNEPVFVDDPIGSATVTDWAGDAPTGISVGTAAVGAGEDEGIVQTVISGGTNGIDYRLKLKATSLGGRDREAFLLLQVRIPTVPT